MTKEKWRYVYFFSGGFAFCLLIFGYVGFSLLVVLGIGISIIADRQIDKHGGKR